MRLTRREVLAGSIAAAAVPASAARPALPQRRLGRTGERVSLLGIGCAPLGGPTSFADAAAVVHAALDAGITYVDVSPDYGNAEAKLLPVLATRRHEVFLVTKVNPNRPDRDGVVAQIEESIKRMGADHMDLVHIHNLGDWNMADVFTDGGALGGLREAKRRGLIRFIGASGHSRPWRFPEAIKTGEIDVVMNALNFVDCANYPFEVETLPAATMAGVGVVAMKVLGGAVGWQYDGKHPGCLAAYHSRAIRYSLGLTGVACAVVGFSSVAEVQAACAVARSYRPLSRVERAALLATGRQLATARATYFGPVVG
ncbi:MAG: aldo/keto reductase [Armatimonadetes bacterium]|nr:aldo/keto reductase [Armatimonadota bacterium]MDE2207187.1 aldo/keto reductase [Armatimonadota bacterium]